MLRLSRRLRSIADMVESCPAVWDVGCDHAYIPIYLVGSGICSFAVASDVREGPLQKARENIERYSMTANITAVISDGLKSYSDIRLPDGIDKINTVIISGMGGPLTVQILEEGKAALAEVECLILQPQSHIEEVRRYLKNSRYHITNEDMIKEDRKFYQVIKAVPGIYSEDVNLISPDIYGDLSARDQELMKEAEDLYGAVLMNKSHPVLKEFLLLEGVKAAVIQNGIRSKSDNQEAMAALERSKRRRDLVMSWFFE